MTIGNRPELLRRTLSSLLEIQGFDNVLAVNDFGDEASNEVFLGHFPHGILVPHQARRGHHCAVDVMYEKVTTPYVMHIEDDWIFDKKIPFASIFNTLDVCPEISMVSLREIDDFGVEPLRDGVPLACFGSIKAYRLTGLHEQWHGYSFNPHITTLGRIRSIDGFVNFKKERHISRFLRNRGLYMIYLQQGGCRHIGDGYSVANVKSRPARRWRNIFSFKR